MKHNFKELRIWQLGVEICRLVYPMVKRFPDFERFELSSQIRRAAVSMPSNIAEGCGRGTNAQLVHFLDIALGSSCELETQMLLAYEFGYCTPEEYTNFLDLLIEFQRKTRSFRDKAALQDVF